MKSNEPQTALGVNFWDPLKLSPVVAVDSQTERRTTGTSESRLLNGGTTMKSFKWSPRSSSGMDGDLTRQITLLRFKY